MGTNVLSNHDDDQPRFQGLSSLPSLRGGREERPWERGCTTTGWTTTGSNVKVSAQARPKTSSSTSILVPRAHDPSGLWQGSRARQKDRGLWGRDGVHLSSTTSKGVVSRHRELTWTWRVITAWKVIAFNWLEILFFSVVVLKSSVRFVDYKID